MLAWPPSQSTTIGHFSAAGFSWPSCAIAETVSGRSEPEGDEKWADRNAVDGLIAFEGRYDNIVLSWSVVGAPSTTSRLKSRGGLLLLEGGYGDERDERRSVKAF